MVVFFAQPVARPRGGWKVWKWSLDSWSAAMDSFTTQGQAEEFASGSPGCTATTIPNRQRRMNCERAPLNLYARRS
jgi:hypothetical protein